MAKFEPEFLNQTFRFECQGSGKCCVSRGEYGHVYLTLKDRRQLAQLLGLSTATFTRKHCKKQDGVFRLKENGEAPECRFLNPSHRCDVYTARPTQCRTWPFWPENMNAKTWKKEVARFCPGVGKGLGVDPKKIHEQLIEQRRADQEVFDSEVFDVAEVMTDQDAQRLQQNR